MPICKDHEYILGYGQYCPECAKTLYPQAYKWSQELGLLEEALKEIDVVCNVGTNHCSAEIKDIIQEVFRKIGE